MKIIYTTETGVAIIHPTGERLIEVVFKKDVPDQYKHNAYIVDDNIIPVDRTYRNAWEHNIDINDGRLVHIILENLNKAKEIHKERLRTERIALLEEQDVLFVKALESGADTKYIVEEKQRLRDITKLVDKVNDTIQLRLIKINTTKEEVDNIVFTATPIKEVEDNANI